MLRSAMEEPDLQEPARDPPDPRLPALFAELHELDAPARAARLEALRSERPELAAELESLLAADAAEDARFAAPLWRLAPDSIPDRIGSYRIEREIGRGGMARVFLAVQEEAEFRRLVALKLLDRPAGAAEDERRFRDEVRILASLEHPGIARFLDGGRSPEGAWYLALEYVEGEDLLSFARARGLGLAERIELFLQVLDAVDFAHRRLIVHRDLKPGNVLIDAEGRAKLLDFGISKVLQEGAAEARTEVWALTPAYASPEQLRGEPVTLATDIYSLGVMLYEILAGRRPVSRLPTFDTDAPAAPRADPKPPSTASRTGTAPPKPVAVIEPAPWRELAGDLDAITLKALRDEPEQRYRSAAAFADDLRRWHKREPVEARRGGRRYRAGRFVSRHRVAVAAAALAFAGLLAGGAAALWQARIAARERDQARSAEVEARRDAVRAERITELLSGVFEAASPFEHPGPIDARELLESGGKQSAEQLAGEPEVRAQLAVQLAEIWLRLGEWKRAQALVEPAVADLERLRGPSDLRTARAWSTLASVRRSEGKNAEAKALLERALAVHRRASGAPDLWTSRILGRYGNVLRAEGDFSGARSALEEAIAGFEALGPGARVDLAKCVGDLGLVLQRLEDWTGAERAHRRAYDILVTAFGADSPRAAVSLINLGEVLDQTNRDPEARAVLEEALRVNQQAFGAQGFAGESVIRNTLAWVLLDAGESSAAAGEFQRAVAAAERERGAGHSDTVWPMRGLAEAESKLGRDAEARAILERALERRVRYWGREHWEVAQSLEDLAKISGSLRDAAAQEGYLREALTVRRAVHAAGHPAIAHATLALGLLLCTRGSTAEGERILLEGLELAEAASPALPATESDTARRALAACG